MDATTLPLFLETSAFVRRWDVLGLSDSDLAALQWALIGSPNAGAVVKKSGGFRKLRFSPPSVSRGKSGAFRVLYLPLTELRAVVLASLDAKNEVATLKAAAVAALMKYATRIESELTAAFKKRKR
jgi:hypothetical protein